ncbi:hypothetical protein BDR05DRAFT_946768 [Suillus weaverae]|nr:hypothetical protein BDR05DRAFT_946768 [Suillus weaverae]
MTLNDLLAISNFLSPDEHIRVSLLEVMVGQCMVIGKEIYCIEFISDHNQLTDDQYIVNSMFHDQHCVYSSDIMRACHPELKRQEFTWVREDAIVCIATHLDDERCLQASVSRLVDAQKDTPGIAALARLGFRIDPALFERVVEICHYSRFMKMSDDTGESLAQKADGSDDMPPNIICPPLPLELWREISIPLNSSPSDGSRNYSVEASMIPHLCGYRLVVAPRRKARSLREQHLSACCIFFCCMCIEHWRLGGGERVRGGGERRMS